MQPAKVELGAAGAPRSRAEIRGWIVAELARALKLDPIAIDACAPLYSLGIDSLTAITLAGALSEWLQRDIPASLMWDHGTVDAIAGALADANATAPPPGVVSLQPHGDRTPLFCFPGTLGHSANFAPLAANLGLDQPCYGLMTPGFEGDHAPLETIEEIAAALLPKIRLLQPKGPYQFAGYSFGGLLCFEAAQQLRRAGETVSVLALYDTFTPEGHIARPRWQRLVIHAYILAARSGRLEHVRRQLQRRREHRQSIAENAPAAMTSAQAREKFVFDLERLHMRAVRKYQPQPYHDRLLLFRATQRSPEMMFFKVDPQTNGWGALAAEHVRIVDMPGTHYNILKPDTAARDAALLRPYLTGAA